MSKLPKEYLKHIAGECSYLLESSIGIDENRFMHDPTFQRSFSRSLEIIGEAVKNLPADFTKQNTQIDWKSVAGMRDRLIHHYFGVDYEIVWDVVKNEIPNLKENISKILKNFK